MNTLQCLLITVVAALPATAIAQFAPRHTPGIMKKLPVAMEHPVNDTPEGTLHDNMAYANTYHYYGYDGEIVNAESHAIITRYVMTSDSTIWWHNPITMQDGGWVRIDHKGGGNYVMHTPQCIIEDEDNIDDEGNAYKAFATRLVLKNYGEGYYYYPDIDEDGKPSLDLHFTLDKDGELRQVNDSIVTDMDDMPYEVLALSNANGDWYGFSNGAMRVWRVNEQPAKLPEGVEPQRYVLTDSTLNQQTGRFSFTRQLIDMAIQGQDAYLAAPDGTGWIRGNVTDDGSICLRPQYIGAAKTYGSHVWFEPATFQILCDNEATDDEDEELEPYEMDYELAPELVLHKTADGAYAANYPAALLINATKGEVLYAADYPVPSLTTFTEKPAVPATPKITEFYPYYEEDGSALFTVRIPVYDQNKEMLDPTLLSYVVYVNDDEEPYTFLPEDYQALSEPMTELSYWFNDGYDFSITDIGHTIYLYVDAEHVGVQSIYRGGGQERRSDIGWDDGSTTTGLKSATTTTKRIESIYDIQGRKLQRLTRGVNIVRMTDGTTRKIIKR